MDYTRQHVPLAWHSWQWQTDNPVPLCLQGRTLLCCYCSGGFERTLSNDYKSDSWAIGSFFQGDFPQCRYMYPWVHSMSISRPCSKLWKWTLEWSLCCAIENKRTDSEIKGGQKYHFLNLQQKTKDVMNLNTLSFTYEGNWNILTLIFTYRASLHRYLPLVRPSSLRIL